MIALENVCVSYTHLETAILQNVHLHISSGEWVSVVGPSGSGKTSLLKVIAGSLKNMEEHVTINDTPIYTLPTNERHAFLRNKVATVYQQFRLLPQFSVLENVMLPLLPYQKRKHLKDKAIQLIDEIGLHHRITHFPHQLSGGEQQRVAFARALLSEPTILLCDEPTGNLDSANRDIIIQLLKQIHAKGKTIILATHDPIVAEQADRTITIQDGVIHEGEVVE
ncbi:ABC transporter ATP-binding protein [Virgibacillus dokdonensis]|uniref:Lipoprotein-releasing system ATP-binding protein LolD n=1 Tax=Virgibacillus dokdonensis TaxID=302167 RepID=A0A2K9IVF7_9BACI|nr:ABC transporter ATP-binding protein [Virgibacillus dokdonensis]AUJ23759.1 Lipoprotein-releasing system ATP-binding protein LolD [Virgibacillus dokdonensis]